MVFNQRASILIVALMFCLIPVSVFAADPAVIQPPAPVHKFLDARNVAVFSLNAAVMVADIVTTRRALQVPGAYEANPLMKSQGATIALKSVSVCAGMATAYMLHKSGHHKAERFIPALFGIPSAIAAVHNAGIHQ
jgi:hypothetical protein